MAMLDVWHESVFLQVLDFEYVKACIYYPKMPKNELKCIKLYVVDI